MTSIGARNVITRLAVLTSAVLLTASCGAFSAGPTTDQATTSENGSSATLGSIRIDDAYVVAPAPDHPTLHLTLANDGTTADRLVAITVGTASSSTLDPARQAVSLPAGAFVDLDNAGAAVPLAPTTPQATAGATLPLHLQFAAAGGVDLDVPVVLHAP